MLKLIPIIIFTIIFYFNSMAQVIIKEEVDLSIEDIGDTTYSLPSMPFYGRVKVERVCSFQWWYTIAAVKVTVGNQSQSTPCYNCGTSGCGACITGSYEFDFNNIPKGTGVSIEEQRCENGNLDDICTELNIFLDFVEQNNYRPALTIERYKFLHYHGTYIKENVKNEFGPCE